MATPRYTTPAIVLHWLLALMILGALAFGLYMTSLPMSPTRLKLINYHKWAGMTILVLSALRLLWRLAHRPPPDPPMPPWQARLAHAVHHGMYLLFFAVPLVGWAYSSAAGFQIVLYGVLPLPNWIAADRTLAEAIKPWHGYLAYGLGTLVILHVAGALKHHFVDRDGLILRMWPFGA
jgi:cytochrome b561